MDDQKKNCDVRDLEKIEKSKRENKVISNNI